MVVVSATSYFPAQARPLMRQYPDNISQQDLETMRKRHPGGDEQIKTLLASTRSFAESYDDMNFTPPHLATIQAQTLIIQGDRDPFYPVEISVEIYRAIPNSSLWIIPNGGHGPIGGERWPGFLKTSLLFLQQ
jgi:pimeloyl-ACP methyl ester carboxylesterase